MDDELVGQTLGGYRIESVAGRGGMGVVYRAYDAALDRRAALKVIRPEYAERPDFIARFRREAKLAAKVRHPNLVSVYAAGCDEGHHFLAMEYVEGQTLEDLLRSAGAVPLPKALRITEAAAQGLAAMHRDGMVHRDIKPANILLEAGNQVRIMDFGLAKPLFPSTKLTQVVARIGTPQYMAPEQYEGLELTPATDVYALGITLYEMLAGANPFHADNLAALAHQVVSRGAPPLDTICPDVAPPVARLVSRMTDRAAENRYRDAAAVVYSIHEMWREHLVPSPEEVPPTTVPRETETLQEVSRQLAAPRPRGWTAYVVGGAFLLALVATLQWFCDVRYLAAPKLEKPQEIVLIGLEEWPPRDAGLIGRILDSLVARKAAVIGLDMVIDAESSLHNPEQLAYNIGQTDNVILASDLRHGHIGGLRKELVGIAAGAGYANVLLDWDGRVRRSRLMDVDSEGIAAKSFALVMAETYWNRAKRNSSGASTRPPTGQYGRDLPSTVYLDFGTIDENPVIPARGFELIAKKWADSFCQDKLFVIGTTASAGDFHRIPLWGEHGRVSGLALQGCILSNLICGTWQEPMSAGIVVGILATAGIVGLFLGIISRGPWLFLAWLFVCVCVLLGAALLLRWTGMLAPVWAPLATVFTASGLSLWRRERILDRVGTWRRSSSS